MIWVICLICPKKISKSSLVRACPDNKKFHFEIDLVLALLIKSFLNTLSWNAYTRGYATQTQELDATLPGKKARRQSGACD